MNNVRVKHKNNKTRDEYVTFVFLYFLNCKNIIFLKESIKSHLCKWVITFQHIDRFSDVSKDNLGKTDF